MLEREVVQMRGFRNIEEGGKVTGFQVRIRSTYYRGVWLSMVRPGPVTVDGEEFGLDKITWVVDGIEYTAEEMLEVTDLQWANTKAVTVKVKKEGGLSQGYHEVGVAYRYLMSYIPPRVNSDAAFDAMPPRYYTRKLIMV